MKNLSTMGWEELMSLLRSEINVLTKIENVEKRRREKEDEIGSLNYQRNSILNYNTKVKIWLILLVYYLLTYGVPTWVALSMREMFGMSAVTVIVGAISYIVGFSVSTLIIFLQKRHLVQKKEEEEKRLPDIERHMAAAQRELSGIQREMDQIGQENGLLLLMVPEAYRSRSALTEIYGILAGQQAYSWRDAVGIYEKNLNHQRMMAQQRKQHEENIRMQQKILAEQKSIREENARYHQQQLELERQNADRAAADAADLRWELQNRGRY